jgi:glycosyltransferase involved in cell wall biosynthesis
MKSFHIITGLNVGGAETMLLKTATALEKSGNKVEVLSLGGGELTSSFIKAGISVQSLNLARSKIPGLSPLMHIRNRIKTFGPIVIQGWMYHANVAASLMKFFFPNTPVIWNVRQTLYEINKEKPLTRFIIRLSAFLSYRADAIIYNSVTSAKQHEHFGFDPSKTIIIPNGFNSEVFCPSREKRNFVRSRLGIPEDKVVIGHVARFHPMKNHQLTLKTALRLKKIFGQSICFVLVGEGVESQNSFFKTYLNELVLNEDIYLLGPRSDIAELTNGFDISLSSSAWGEAFPNSIGEAMSCGVPCVATDVGDVRTIVGEGGIVVAPSEEDFYHALKQLIEIGPSGRGLIGEKGRVRVLTNFTIENIVHQYLDLYNKLCSKK